MPRPRVHDLDTLLDAAEKLAATAGPSAVTVRAVSDATGVSNGAIYHAFGSRSGLVGSAWLRAARRFLALQQSRVDDALADPSPTSAVSAVVAAAEVPAVFALDYPQSALLLLTIQRDELLGTDVPADIAEQLTQLDRSLVELFIRLWTALWGRKDGRAVEAIEACVVGLPTGLLIHPAKRADGWRVPDAAARARLDAAERPIMTATLRFEDKIAVLDLGEDENRFSPEWLDSVDKLLDQALSESAHALVTTATGKFYSNGLDLDWLGANGDKAKWYVQQVQSLFARMLTFPMPTVAAINGHAFGAGAMLGIAHDYRVMRDDRGYYCFPEVDINIPFTEGMAALIQAKLSPASAIVAMTTGRRYGGSDAFAAGLVDFTASVDALTAKAIEMVAPIGPKNAGTLGAIKSTMFASVVTALNTD
eukprot:gene24356-29216_t